MRKINGITEDPKQILSVPLDDGSTFEMTLSFMPRRSSWYIVSLTHLDFKLNGYRIYNSPNILHQFRNLIPFGIGCFSVGDREPMLLEDFGQGSSELYVLDSEETERYWKFISGT